MGQVKSFNKDINDEKFFKSQCDLGQLGDYKGASIFVICNGPSFAKLDHSLLRKPGIITYGMNNGPKTFRPNFWTCVDSPSRFLMSIWKDPKITKIIPFGLASKQLFNSYIWSMTNDYVKDCPNVIGFKRNEKFIASQFLTEDTFNWGNHKDYGGGRSVMLPIMRICYELGFRKVYLLGCDFNMSENNTYHFDEQRHNGAVKCNRKTYGRLENEYFPQLKPYFDEKGFKVFNCNPESGLTCFPFISFEQAISDTIAPLGDIPNERTWGMYSGEEKKADMKVEPPESAKKNLSTITKVDPKPPQITEKPIVTVIPIPTTSPSTAPFNNEDVDESSEGEEQRLVKEVEIEPPIVKTFADAMVDEEDIEETTSDTTQDISIKTDEVSIPEPSESITTKNIENQIRNSTQKLIFPPPQPPIQY